MTWIAAGRYMDRYYWISDEYGRSWESMDAIRDQWYTNGSLQENPKLSMAINYDYEEPYLCSYDDEACSCNGRIYYGLRTRPDNGEEIDTFQGLMSFAKMSRKSSYDNGEVMCNQRSM